MKRNWKLFKLIMTGLAVIPISQATCRTNWQAIKFLPKQKLAKRELVNFLPNNPQFNQMRYFGDKSNKSKDERILSIPKVEVGKRGTIYYCLSTKKGNYFPSVIVWENGNEVEYRLPDWYGEWVLMSWAMNDASFPSWVEFGKLENGNYYAELLGDNQEVIEAENQEQKEKIDEWKKIWLEAAKKFK